MHFPRPRPTQYPASQNPRVTLSLPPCLPYSSTSAQTSGRHVNRHGPEANKHCKISRNATACKISRNATACNSTLTQCIQA